MLSVDSRLPLGQPGTPIKEDACVVRRWFGPWGSGLLVPLVLPATGFADAQDLKKSIADNPMYMLTVGIDTVVGDRRGIARDVHAGRLRLPRDRVLPRARTPGTIVAKNLTTSRSPRRLLGRRLRARVRRRRQLVGHPRRLLPVGSARPRQGHAAVPPASGGIPVPRRSSSSSSSSARVSLAIVWGTTLERIKFGVYIIYAVDLLDGHLPGRSRTGSSAAASSGGALGTASPHAGLRRLDGRPPDRARPARFAALLLLGPRQRQVRQGRQAAGRSPATTCRCSASAS